MVSQVILDNISNGLNQLQSHCQKLYPQQEKNFIKSKKSFLFEGGPDPLDYIYVFKNEGDQERSIPKHWHYVGFGLSNIYNYGQMLAILSMDNPPVTIAQAPTLEDIYPPPSSTKEQLSGFGFELTFRIRCNSAKDWEQNKPPKWPCSVMQALAKHVYTSKNSILDGENFYWSVPLAATNCPTANHVNNESVDTSSIIKHILTTIDPQISETETTLGKVKFIQLVGVTREELQAAREWSGKGVMNIMKTSLETGGEYLITDMKRTVTISQLDPNNNIKESINRMGSNMIIVNATHKYSSRRPSWYQEVENYENNMTHIDFNDEHDEDMSVRCPSRQSRISYESESALKLPNADKAKIRCHDSVYLLMPLKSAKLLPVALERRLAQGKTFTFKNIRGDLCITLFPEKTESRSMVNRDQPYIRQGVWLQIYISEELRCKMVEKMTDDLKDPSKVGEKSIKLPKNYSWPEHSFHITVVSEIN